MQAYSKNTKLKCALAVNTLLMNAQVYAFDAQASGTHNKQRAIVALLEEQLFR